MKCSITLSGFPVTVSVMFTYMPLVSPCPCQPWSLCQSVSVPLTLYCFHGHGYIPPGGKLPGCVVPVRSSVSNAKFMLSMVTWASPVLIAMTNLPFMKS